MLTDLRRSDSDIDAWRLKGGVGLGASREPTPGGTVPEEEDDDEEDEEEISKDADILDLDTDAQVYPKLSAYERSKDRNIAQNKILLDSLGLGGSTKPKPAPVTKGKGKKAAKKPETNTVPRQSPRLHDAGPAHGDGDGGREEDK